MRAILALLLLSIAAPALSGSGPVSPEQAFCAELRDHVYREQRGGKSLEDLKESFETWLRDTPEERRNDCYSGWCTGATRELIGSAFDQAGGALELDYAWTVAVTQRCLAWSRGEVHEN